MDVIFTNSRSGVGVDIKKTKDDTTYFCPKEKLRGTFHLKPDNRIFDPNDNAQVRNLMQSMEKNGFARHHPIIAKSDGEIQSGNHRFCAAVKLGIGVHYKIDDEYDFEAETRIDGINRGWKTLDWITKFANEGKGKYPEILEFINTHYSYLGMKVIHSILAGKANHQDSTKIFHLGSGDFVPAVTFEEADRTAQMMKEIYDIIPSKKKSTNGKGKNARIREPFAFAMLAMFKAEGYDHLDFLENLKKQSERFTIQVDRASNISQLQSAYNYNKRSKFIKIINEE